MEMFTSANFESEVLGASGPVLVDFFATWCGPCKIMAPVLEKLSEEFAGRVVIGKLDVEESGDIAMKYGIMNVPTVLIFKNGVVTEKLIGLHNQNELRKAIESVL
ncbi:MAG: thioredoxin [Lachnospiraceae bacterium]|nr:thioredoxin [Lachnospiraceae bacterium]